MTMDALKSMWESIPPASPGDLAGARRRVLDGMHARRRFVTVPRLLVAAGVAAAAAVTPLVLGTGTAAYAVTENADGTLMVTINELRDPDGLEAELDAAGIKADVTFLPPGKRCAVPRFKGVDASYGGPPVSSPDELRSQAAKSRSYKAIKHIPQRGFQIHPQYIKPGETLVLEFTENPNPAVLWRFGGYLARAGSPVQPCTLVDDAG